MSVMNTIAMLVGYACLMTFTLGGLAFAVVAILAHQRQREMQREWVAHQSKPRITRADVLRVGRSQ